MYSEMRIFPITAFGTDGYPTVGEPFPLYKAGDTEQEVNNIDNTLEPDVATKSKQADNRRVSEEVLHGYNGTTNVYGIDQDAMSKAFGYYLDGNSNLVVSANEEPKHVAIFLRGKNENGKKYNQWIYDAVFNHPSFSAAQEGDSASSISVTYYASLITATIGTARKTFATAIVYEGNEGYIDEGTEPTTQDLYKPTAPAA